MPNFFVGVLTFFILVTNLSAAAQSSPPQEFWEYFEEYSDDQGELLDPLDYEQMLIMKDSELETDIANEKPVYENEPGKHTVSSAAAKVKSSGQASSVSLKGANL